MRPINKASSRQAANLLQHALDRDVAHASVMLQPAVRFVTGPAGQVRQGFDDARDRVERSPVPRARRSKYSDGRRTDGGGDVEQSGIIRYSEISPAERQNSVAK